jgi:hypothetical protein
VTPSSSSDRAARRTAAALCLTLFVIYNLNGREIGTTDSQPAKFTAREVAVMGTLTLDRVVAERPGLGDRAAFARARDGHVRSAYPLLPALIAAMPATALHRTGIVDMDAPLAPNLIAAMTASGLTAMACALLLLALRRIVSLAAAVATSAALGLGTNYWAVVSQTLWQHETVAFGLALTLWAWLREDSAISPRLLAAGGVGLAMAGAARPQTVPMILAMIGWIAVRAGTRRSTIPAAIVAAAGALVVATNLRWFGHPLGAAPLLEAIHPAVHGVTGSIGERPWIGALGLLVSPSRGLVVLSPIVLIALSGIGTACRSNRTGWLVAGIIGQFAAYAAYSVWWAGHTFGPRYMIDLLPLLAPIAATGWERVRGVRAWRVAAGVLLAWSVGVAGLGAFVYPNEAWNTRPDEVDRHHERLWEVRDSQIPRALRSAPSPQNGSLWARDAFDRP